MATQGQKLVAAGTAILIAEPLLALAHTGGIGVIVGLVMGAAAYSAVDDVEKLAGVDLPPLPSPAALEKQPGQRSFMDRLVNGKNARLGSSMQEDHQEMGPDAQGPADGDPLFARPDAADTGGVARLTIEQIVSHCEPNSYQIWIGRSLTKPGNPAVLINIYKQHFRFMGASQRGKSSMVGAFLEIICRTHDTKHVRLMLLDKENRTSNLFAHLPHVLSMKKADGHVVKLHATNDDEVLEYLIHAVAIMKHRYTLPQGQVIELPIILVYIEEFLALKNEFKARISKATTKEARDRATSDYATLVYCIEFLSQMGLKVRVQLLLCAQVEYADDDFREALVNVQCGFAFCVRPRAAESAGFQNGELIRRNAKENKVGQAVVETPDCNDLVLSPEYDLEKRLLAFERVHGIHHSPETSPSELENAVNARENVNAENMVNAHEKPVNASVNAREYSQTSENILPAFTPSEETQVLLAYAELLKVGKTITRTGIRDHLGWDNKQYQRVIKPVCDKHGIAVAKEA